MKTYILEETGDESAMSATLDNESSMERGSYRGRGRRKEKKERKERNQSKCSRSTSTSPIRSPPRWRIWSRPRSSTSKKRAAKDTNPKNCPFCKEFVGYGLAHAAPKNVPHENCNYNKNWKGWKPEWVCKKIGIIYRESRECDELQFGDLDEKVRKDISDY